MSSTSRSQSSINKSSGVYRFLFESPKSVRNFIIILATCIAFDVVSSNDDSSNNSFSLFYNIILPLAQSPMLEPVVAVLSFLLACLIFSISEPYYYKWYRNNSSPPIINGSLSAWAFWATSNIGLYLGIIYIFQKMSGYNQESFYYVSKSWNDDATVFVYTRIFLEVFISIFLYDLVFSLIHQYLFHPTINPKTTSKIAIWFQKLHLTHHDHYADAGKQPLHVMNTFHHHIIDATAQIAINAILQQTVSLNFGPTQNFDFFPKRHVMSKFLHNMFVTYLLVESHSGQDWSWMTHRFLFPEWFVGGAVSHQKHHDTGKAPYHQFFTIFDGEF